MNERGKFIIWISLAFLTFTVVFTTCNMCGDAAETVQKEFAPSEMLRKYEWFKDASAQLDQKRATIESYSGRFVAIKSSYGPDSLNRKVWNRSDIDQYNIWQSEYLGIKASYNDLAAQYNSAMAKFNYAFCNAGQLPQGAEMVLPREYRTYISQ